MVAPKHERLKAADVCQLAQIQPYVLRTWETEFPDLGRSTSGAPRTYSRADVERVLRIRELVFNEGLTLAGARRRLEETEAAAADGSTPADEFVLVDERTRSRVMAVKRGLQAVLELLNRPVAGASFELEAPATAAAGAARSPRRSKRSA